MEHHSLIHPLPLLSNLLFKPVPLSHTLFFRFQFSAPVSLFLLGILFSLPSSPPPFPFSFSFFFCPKRDVWVGCLAVYFSEPFAEMSSVSNPKGCDWDSICASYSSRGRSTLPPFLLRLRKRVIFRTRPNGRKIVNVGLCTGDE